jgi:hypothetical protein
MTEVRELRAKDLKTVAKMLGKLKTSSVADIFASLDKSNPMQTGIALFRIVAADLTDDIYAWLADLAGKTPAEFDEMPVTAPIEIIKELIGRGDFKDFLAAAGRSPDTTTSSSPVTDGQTTK